MMSVGCAACPAELALVRSDNMPSPASQAKCGPGLPEHTLALLALVVAPVFASNEWPALGAIPADATVDQEPAYRQNLAATTTALGALWFRFSNSAHPNTAIGDEAYLATGLAVWTKRGVHQELHDWELLSATLAGLGSCC